MPDSRNATVPSITAAGDGVSVGRRFTEPGLSPFDAVEWEIRDAVIGDPEQPAFEQRGVEFPKSWSQNATNIVAQKYFRGRLDSPERERSVRQMIGRVAGTIAAWGREGGYFASGDDAQAFEDELTHILLHQMAAFNSPVWFNVGFEESPQCSACFLLSVEDTLESILAWNTKEGLVFRGGSGSGINLSKIRGSKEQLSKGGYASGPVSFMRGADAWAGTIKSGGKTRRAAKMVVLDVDHPDILDFIWCKAREEEKAAALRDAGFDMRLDSEAFASIQYQNANNSVRLSDEFMERAERGQEWELTARVDGSVLERVDARDVLNQIADAAWRCADPGVQYDTTIQDWHTCPNSGRISTSNPCSEYLHVDDSACNLGSLNLMKFRHSDGSFDVKAFQHVVDVVFLAQEIVVGPSSYPTEEIGKNARAFRQIGLGYANLGALLMANGLPYDSDEGRELAGAITALMTGRAYRRSAEIARDATGPYARYEENREPHNHVMRKHRAAAYKLSDELWDQELLAAARRAWDEAVELGEEHGYRNAQAVVIAPTGTISFLMDCDTTGIEPDFSLVKFKELVGGGQMTIVNQTVALALETLGYPGAEIEQIKAHLMERGTIVGAPGLKDEHLPVFDVAVGERAISPMGHIRMMAAAQPFVSGAISKCVVANTLVASTDGLVRIGGLHEGEQEDSFRPMSLRVASLDGLRDTDAFYYGGQRATIRVKLRSGHQVVGTPNHRVLVGVEGGGLEWRRLDELGDGDHVATQYGDELWSERPARFDDFAASPRHGSQKSIRVPVEMSEELAFFLGAYAAEGHVARSNHTVRIANTDEGVIARLVESAGTLFGIHARVARNPGKCPSVELTSKTLVEFLDHLGCGDRASSKRIPDAVLRSPRGMVLAFLEGLSLDSYLPHSVPKWAICLASNALLDDLQAVLTNLGVVHSRITKYNAEYDRSFDEVYASGRHAQRFASLLRFPEAHKATRAAALQGLIVGGGTADLVPGISGRELYELVPKGRSGRSGRGTGTSHRFRHLLDARTSQVSRGSLEEVATVPEVDLPNWLEVVLERNLHFSPVAEISDGGEREVFDISVPSTHAFVGNGIVNHNTVNLPESATVEDIASIYTEGWKLGLKALAIYRDGSKTAQALKTDGGTKTADEAEAAAALEPARPVRRRMPRERHSLTHKFSIAGHEGYITAGEYEDGTVGEVFLTDVGKEGSTIKGLMNAFATAISIGLQYGVPLETFVRKFAYMRFEPEGYTGNPEIPFAKSMPDYIMRWVASRYGDAELQEELGILTPEVRARKAAEAAAMRGDTAGAGEPEAAEKSNGGNGGNGHANGGDGDSTPSAGSGTAQPPTAALTDEPPAVPAKLQGLELGPACAMCGGMMQRTGSCYTCSSCGNNTGCG
jgi:adenosylcobalamin-dependent ribonucleoside-diphosphate reductase